ncbi:MAG: ribosome-associated translation inhibitor RaiA [Patescibacteria group bacterium]
MKCNIKTTNITLDAPLQVYIEEKIGTLGKFVPQHVENGVAEAWVEIGKTSQHHKTGFIWRAECDIRLPGKILRAEDIDIDLRVAIDHVKDDLQRQLTAYKEKTLTKTKRKTALVEIETEE